MSKLTQITSHSAKTLGQDVISAELTIRECLIRYLYTSPFIVVVRNIINSVVDQSHGETIENALKNETLNS